MDRNDVTYLDPAEPALESNNRAGKGKKDPRTAAVYMNKVCPPGFYLRKQLQRLAHISESDFRSLERTGEIAADKHNSRGFGLYDQSWVERIKAIKKRSKVWTHNTERSKRMLPASRKKKVPYSEDIGVKGVEILRAGGTVTDIVTKLRVHPAIAMTILKDYGTLTNGLWIPGDVLALINTLPLDGVFPISSPKEFLDILITAANELRCATEDCNKRRSRYCKVCQEALKGKISQGVSSSDNSNAESSREHSHSPTKTDDDRQSQGQCPDTHHV